MKKRILAVLLIGISIFTLTGCGEEGKYEKAIEAYNGGDYDEAVALFGELGDYEDAKVYLSESQHLVIEKYINNGEYDIAQEKASKYEEDSSENDLVKKTEVDIEFDKVKNICIKKEWNDTSLYKDILKNTNKDDEIYNYVLDKLLAKGLEYADHLETGSALQLFGFLEDMNYENANVYSDFVVEAVKIQENNFIITSEQKEDMQEYYDDYGIYPAIKYIDGTYKNMSEEELNKRYHG